MTSRLEAELEAAILWLSDLGYIDDYDTVMVRELPFDLPSVEERPAVLASEFADRFDETLEVGARDWVNLNFQRQIDRKLYFVVEYFSERNDGVRFRSDQISVNHSGPEY